MPSTLSLQGGGGRGFPGDRAISGQTQQRSHPQAPGPRQISSICLCKWPGSLAPWKMISRTSNNFIQAALPTLEGLAGCEDQHDLTMEFLTFRLGGMRRFLTSAILAQGSANFLCEVLGSKYCRLCTPCHLCHHYCRRQSGVKAATDPYVNK